MYYSSGWGFDLTSNRVRKENLHEKARQGKRRPNNYGSLPPQLDSTLPPSPSSPPAYLMTPTLAKIDPPHHYDRMATDLAATSLWDGQSGDRVDFYSIPHQEKGVSLDQAFEALKRSEGEERSEAFVCCTPEDRQEAQVSLLCFIVCGEWARGACGAIAYVLRSPQRLLISYGVRPGTVRRLYYSAVRAVALWVMLLLMAWYRLRSYPPPPLISFVGSLVVYILLGIHALEALFCDEHAYLCAASRFWELACWPGRRCWRKWMHACWRHCCANQRLYWTCGRDRTEFGFTHSLREYIGSLRSAKPQIRWHALSYHVNTQHKDGRTKRDISVTHYATATYPGIRWVRDVTADTDSLLGKQLPFASFTMKKAFVFADDGSRTHYHWHMDEFVRHNERDEKCHVWTTLHVPGFADQLLAVHVAVIHTDHTDPAHRQLLRHAALTLAAFYCATALLLTAPFRCWMDASATHLTLAVVKEIAAGNLPNEATRPN